MKKVEAKPFLKWAGGKTQLLDEINKRLPQEINTNKITKYVEPFVGGGAVFFYLKSKYDFEKVILNDVNKECILTYRVIQGFIDDLINILFKIEDEFLGLDTMDEKDEMYYKKRGIFNKRKITIDYNKPSEEWIEHAALMIFLNKTCFNGLYRENRKGFFNVPFGKRKNPTICDEQNLRKVSIALKNVELKYSSFDELTQFIDNRTLVYIDPPYRPLNATSNFNDYSKEPFNDESQKKLAQWFRKLDIEKNAFLMLSNSDPTNIDPDDDFFDKLYAGFNIERVKASRAINSKGNRRGEIRELLITNKSGG